ncbi:MAG TPA: hypothetical protein VN026_06610 [Bacteroidia bacterium]|nr:hypothetical protein [Bacteroidia bacterium]
MKTKLFIFLLFLIWFCFDGFSQNDSIVKLNLVQQKQKGSFYFTFGYTRCTYSKSTIHFEDHSGKMRDNNTGKPTDYDFTIYNATAKDRPDFDKIPDVVNITVPQFVVHAGYYFNDKKDLGIEINYDHAKYVVDDYQRIHVKGQFNGNYVDKDTILDPKNFLHFEHTDGANFVMVNILKRWKLYNPGKLLNIGWVAKAGGGAVYPRTDVTIFGERLNNNWHIAGWIVGVETGMRVEFLKHGVFEFTSKGTFADYSHCLVLGKGNGRARHTFFCGQLTATIGFVIK